MKLFILSNVQNVVQSLKLPFPGVMLEHTNKTLTTSKSTMTMVLRRKQIKSKSLRKL